MPKIKPKGYLTKFNTANETRIRIAFCLYKSGEPLTLSELSKESKISPQLLNYHLPKLIKEGILLKMEEDGNICYILQPFFYDENIMEGIYGSFLPIVTLIGSGFLDEQMEVSEEEGFVNCIQTLLHFVGIEIHKLKKN